MPTGGFMNESFHYYDQQGQDINHYPYHSDTSLQYHQYSMDQSDLYQQNHYQDNTFAYYQQPIEEYPIHTHPWQEPSEPYIEWAEPMINHNNNNNNTTPSSSNCSSPRLKEKKLNSSGRNVRQITVRSVNKEHRVWIDILPTETGISLANKIHRIATFGTRKVLKITTAHGRVIPLDPRPIFGNWMDMNTFEDGEHWQVEWGDLDKSLVDKFFSKVIQVGGKR
ncbi:uncharacterized protein BX664DRAFT_320624 [Halteromyces radiatus]|uniref:uncharacterized protein n=1 Tax=Halteromyces radiatus TaxID=101107 RepID=UPI0022202550|nr:uncharacterized protein BX664DRAFT_320624 [Halteromyces radiatus]KAI8099194.1 hypothetical protein BX664DRAFT_320624 [Halteromyces radiatus]